MRSCTSSLNSTPLHLYPGRPLWSYLRNLANMVNRAAKKLGKKMLTLRLQAGICSLWETILNILHGSYTCADSLLSSALCVH